MSTRTITGNLLVDVEVVKAGSINITKLRVIENTGEYRLITTPAKRLPGTNHALQVQGKMRNGQTFNAWVWRSAVAAPLD